MTGAGVAGVVPAEVSADAEAGNRRCADLAAAHYPFVWRVLRRMGVSDAQAAVDDAAQQVFLVALQKIDTIEVGRERSFLFQTALRVAMSLRRNVARRREVIDEEECDAVVDTAPRPDERAEERQRRAHLDAVLDTLPAELRAVFVLFELEGMGAPEISSLLELPVGTVASRLRRARELFRDEAMRLRLRLERRGTR